MPNSRQAPRAPVRITLADVGSALPDLLLAGSFLIAWINPSAPFVPPVRRLVMIVLLEFFIVHSSGFMGVVAFGERRSSTKIAATVGLAAFYTLFLVAFSLGFKDWWLLGSFWMLMANRLVGILLGQAPDDKRQAFIMGTWAMTVAAYLFAVAIGAAAGVPALGITPAVVQAQGFSMGGVWTETPETALAAGAIYFATVGVWELLVPAIVFRRERALEERAMVVTA